MPGSIPFVAFVYTTGQAKAAAADGQGIRRPGIEKLVKRDLAARSNVAGDGLSCLASGAYGGLHAVPDGKKRSTRAK